MVSASNLLGDTGLCIILWAKGFPVFSVGPLASAKTSRPYFLLCLVLLFTTYLRKGFLLLRFEVLGLYFISGKACIEVSSPNEGVTV